MVGRVRQFERQSTKESRRCQLGGVVFVAHEYQATAVSYTKPANGFCEGIYQSVTLHSLCIDMSVSVTIGVYLPCIDQGIDF